MNKNTKIIQNAMALVLLAYIGIMVSLNLVLPDRAFSESENRVLEQRPHFSVSDLIEGRFTANYESYIADQFALRDFWIGVKSDLERVLGKRESNGVYLGKEGCLLQQFVKPDQEAFQEKVEKLNAFAAATPGLDKYFLLAPTAVKIWEDKLPFGAPVDDQLVYMNKLRESLDQSINYVDVYETLASHRDEPIYYKTDHHWTTAGAFYAYEKLASVIGFTPCDRSCFQVKKVTDSFYGSLYSKGGFRHLHPDSIELYLPQTAERYQVEYYDDQQVSDSLYSMDNLEKKDKYTVFLNGNQSLIKITTAVDNGKNLLVLKDSYANCLIPFLTGHYHEIYVVDLRYYSDDLLELIKANGIEEVLFLYNAQSFFEGE
jgi:hypothetical protein